MLTNGKNKALSRKKFVIYHIPFQVKMDQRLHLSVRYEYI